MRSVPLRRLILVSVLMTVSVAFVVFAVYLDTIERDNRLSDIDAELIRAERANVGPNQPPTGPVAGPPIGDEGDGVTAPTQLLVDADGTLLGASNAGNPFDDQTLAELAGADGTVTTKDPRYRTRVSQRRDGTVSVTALGLDDHDDAVRRFRVALGLGGGLILAVVGAMVWVLAGFLARPVTRMAAAANRIAGGDLETPVPTGDGPLETADLADHLNLMIDQLRTHIERSDRARAATEHLIADLAHEIRTPLTALRGYSDLHRQGMLATADDLDRAMERIGSESQRLNDLADRMLALTREGSAPRQTARFGVDDLVGEIVLDLRAAHPDHEVAHVAGAAGADIDGDRGAIQQAVLNVAANACQHTPAGTSVTLRTATVDGEVTIRVIDRGPGIDPAQAEQIFAPFYRTDRARARTGDHGAGLGLTLARRITDDHAGSIACEPTDGGGATFTLRFPVAPT